MINRRCWALARLIVFLVVVFTTMAGRVWVVEALMLVVMVRRQRWMVVIVLVVWWQRRWVVVRTVADLLPPPMLPLVVIVAEVGCPWWQRVVVKRITMHRSSPILVEATTPTMRAMWWSVLVVVVLVAVVVSVLLVMVGWLTAKPAVVIKPGALPIEGLSSSLRGVIVSLRLASWLLTGRMRCRALLDRCFLLLLRIAIPRRRPTLHVPVIPVNMPTAPLLLL